ncbi:alpha-N-acetylneuraminate alpha-2,8-sialyltransferase ST8SIA3-like isoform X1 [Branchiostoma floridae x Branchiostoma belcheri]
MAPTAVNRSWRIPRNPLRCMSICVAILTAFMLIWVMSSRELVVPVMKTSHDEMPTPSLALVMRTQSAPDRISGTSAPDSPPQVEADSLKEVREMSPLNTTNHTMPTRTGETSTSKEVENILNLLKQVNSKQAASTKEVQSLPPTTQPDWVFGNLAPDSPWKFNATALKEIRNITAVGLNLKSRLQEHKWGNVTKPALPIGHYNACAVVGNSGVLLGSRCGAEIDSMDYVIRIDLPVLRGFEEDVGGRTNMTILNLKTPRRLAESSHLKNRSLDVYENRLQDVKDSVLLGDYRARENIMKALPVYKLPFSVVVTKNRLRTGVMSLASKIAGRSMKKTPTIGLVSVLMMTSFCDHAYIYGFFPFFKDKNNVAVPYHYFPNDNLNSHRNPPLMNGFDALHSVDQEYDFHRELHRRGAVKMQLGPCGKR